VSEANVELVRRTYELINDIGRTEGDFVDPEELSPEVWARLAPDFELHERSDLPDTKIYRTREESKAFWRKTQEIFAEIRWEPVSFVDRGDVIVVEAKIVATGRESDVPVALDETDVFWFRDGLIVRLKAFPSTAEALDALSGPARR
jgi:ketosteroid isomerase-like protein